MHVTRFLIAPTVVGCALLLAACGGTDGDTAAPDAGGSTNESAPGEDEDDSDAEGDAGDVELAVVATVAPIADLVTVVGGDRVVVNSLVPAGADAHTYEPRPQDVVELSGADAYIGVGLDLNEGALRLARENLPEGAPLVLLGEQMLEDQDLVFDHSHDDDDHGHTHDDGDHGHTHDDGDHGHTHDDDDGTHSHGDDDHGHTHDDDDHGHTHDDDDGTHSHGDDNHGHTHDDGAGDAQGNAELGPNPHVWTSVRNAATLVEGIAATLSDLDPAGAEQYTANATAYRGQLGDLDDRITTAVATIPDDNRVLVTYHDAWSYFARDHDLVYETAIQPADFSEPSAGELRALVDQIRELDVPAVFGSEVFPTPVLEAIAEETDADYVGDLADDVLPGNPGDPEHSYLELMRRNAHTIVTGLDGDAGLLEE